MGAPKIYRWDDANAPVLNGLAGSGWNLLKKCLVEGYGEKQPAGWSMLFEDAGQQIGVLQGNTVTGTGAIFQVNDNGVDTLCYGGRSFTVYGYESMTDEVTGSGQWGALSGMGFRKSNSADGNPRGWVVVADDRAVYIFAACNNTSGSIAESYGLIAGYFFGDGVPYSAGDMHFAMIIAGPYYGWPYFGLLCAWASVSSAYHAMWRNMSLALHGGGFGVMSNGAIGDYGMGSLNTYSYPWFGQTLISRPIVNNGAACAIRGELPGLFAPGHYAPFNNFATISINGVDYLAMKIYEYDRYGQVLIDITAGFRP